MKEHAYSVHHSAFVDDDVTIGEGTKIWHFSKLLGPCAIGKNCVLGHNVVVERNVSVGNGVRIQNNVSVYSGVTLEDDVFCGPSMVFTNVTTPRSHYPRRDALESTLVKRGASIGANATVICGTTIHEYAMVGAGSVVTKDVPAYSLVVGVPARLVGHVCYCGTQLAFKPDNDLLMDTCSTCGRVYKREGHKVQPCP